MLLLMCCGSGVHHYLYLTWNEHNYYCNTTCFSLLPRARHTVAYFNIKVLRLQDVDGILKDIQPTTKPDKTATV